LPFVWTHKIQPKTDHRLIPHLGERRPKLSCGSDEGISSKRPLTETGIIPSFRNDYFVGWMETRSMVQALERLI